MGLFTLWQTPIDFLMELCSNTHMMKTKRIKQALRYAATHFEVHGIRRKYTLVPYIQHPIAVARMVARFGADENQVIAAILHDSVEDCISATIESIHEQFGDDVAQLVLDLTDISKPTDGNRKIRKAIDRDHSAHGSARAQTIKYCDLIDNTRDITAHDKDFAVVYLREKEALLNVLTKGDIQLRAIAWEELFNAKAKLSIV